MSTDKARKIERTYDCPDSDCSASVTVILEALDEETSSLSFRCTRCGAGAVCKAHTGDIFDPTPEVRESAIVKAVAFLWTFTHLKKAR